MQYVMPTERKISISQILFFHKYFNISFFASFFFLGGGGWLKAVLIQDINTVLHNIVNEFPTYQKLLEIFKMLILFHSSSVLNYIVYRTFTIY
jgi:hypothetical protein